MLQYIIITTEMFGFIGWLGQDAPGMENEVIFQKSICILIQSFSKTKGA